VELFRFEVGLFSIAPLFGYFLFRLGINIKRGLIQRTLITIDTAVSNLAEVYTIYGGGLVSGASMFAAAGQAHAADCKGCSDSDALP
jgi:hypothetical protein